MEIKAENIHKAYGSAIVLNGISFSVAKGQKVGLVGYNGTGKTTLFNILAGIIKQDDGIVTMRPGATLGYLPQDTSISSEETVRDYVRRVSGMAALEKDLEESPEAMEEYIRRDGYTFNHRLKVMLAGFGLPSADDSRQLSLLSSGQRSKVFMVGMLLSDPDIMLLDEPTNNLDLPALIWLESFLARSDAACIIISHDRQFLDRLVQKIFEIDWQTRSLNVTNGRYSDYLLRKDKERIKQLSEHEAQQEEIKRLEENARKKKQEALSGSRYTGTDNDKFLRGFKRDRASKSGKQAKAMEKRIQQMDIIDKPVERSALRIQIQPGKLGGKSEIVLADLVAGYLPISFKLGPISLTIPYGDRIAILGLNGTGKTTLLRTISGELAALSGEVIIGGSLVVGNLTQEHSNLPRGETIKNFLVQRVGVDIQDAYLLATRFGFKADEIDKGIGDLSPGGRARLLFAVFSALSTNVLILDEPTNHLDIEAVVALEEAVAHFEGTIIVVTHDRSFIEKLKPTEIFVMSEGQLARLPNLKDYVDKAERQAKQLISLI